MVHPLLYVTSQTNLSVRRVIEHDDFEVQSICDAFILLKIILIDNVMYHCDTNHPLPVCDIVTLSSERLEVLHDSVDAVIRVQTI